MGANFQAMSVKSHDCAEARKAFEAAQDQDRYENGNSYSGGLGMASGLHFNDEPRFLTEDEADGWLSDNASKWEAAEAVKIVSIGGGFVCWRIGANCAA